MGGVLDFLFGGNPPANAPPTGGTRNVPRAISDFGLNVAGKINAVMNDPYSQYNGPRIASPTQDTQTGWQMARDTAGAYQPSINGALTQSQGTMGQVDPYFNQGATGIQGGMGRFTGDTVNQYMNPYINNVINRSSDLAMRDWNEKMMPQLNSQFIGSGQYGSLGHEGEAMRGARDVVQNIQDTAGAQLAGAYDTGQNAFGQDQNRQITGGQSLGNLASQYGNLADSNATNQANIANSAQQLGLRGAAALDTVGQEQQANTQKSLDLANQDFQNQRDWQKNQLNWGVGTMAGMPQQSTTSTYTGPASSYGPNGLQSIGQMGALVQGISGMIGQARGGMIRPRRYASGGLAALANGSSDIGNGGDNSGVPPWLGTILAAILNKGGGHQVTQQQFPELPIPNGPASGGGQSSGSGGGSGGVDDILNLFKGNAGTGRNVDMTMSDGAPEWLPDSVDTAAGQVPGSTSLWTAPTAESLGTTAPEFTMAGAVPAAAETGTAAWAAPTAASLGAPASEFTMAGAVPAAETGSAAAAGGGAGGAGAGMGVAGGLAAGLGAMGAWYGASRLLANQGHKTPQDWVHTTAGSYAKARAAYDAAKMGNDLGATAHAWQQLQQAAQSYGGRLYATKSPEDAAKADAIFKEFGQVMPKWYTDYNRIHMGGSGNKAFACGGLARFSRG